LVIKVNKKQDQRLSDMKKLLQRELKAGPGGNGADAGSHISNQNTFNVQSGANGTHSQTPPPSGSRSNIYASESYPNLSTAAAATLPVSYSVSHHSVTYNGQAGIHNAHFPGAEEAGEGGAIRGNLTSSGGGAGASHKQHSRAGSRDWIGDDDLSRLLAAASGSGGLVDMGGVGGPPSSSGLVSFSLPDEEYDFTRELNFKYLRHVILKFLLSRESEVSGERRQ